MGSPLILDGLMLAKEIEAELTKEAAAVFKDSGKKPTLAAILVGNNPASVTYVKMKGRDCKRVGIDFKKVAMPESTTTEELLAKIDALNHDPDVHGILLQHPVPRHIDEKKCFDAIAVSKDADGVNSASFGAMAMGMDCGFKCATPMAVMMIIERFGIKTAGKNAVVIGRSAILGKPAAMLLLNADATVTICHSRTEGLPDIVRRADIIVAAVGKPKFVQADWVKEGAVIIDAGYNAGNVGDVDLENAAAKSSAYTPVPGGVGPVTRAALMKNTLTAAKRTLGI